MPNYKLQTPRDRVAMEKRRMEGVELLKQGMKQSEVARRLGVVRQAVSQWAAALRQGGKAAVKSKGKPGPKTTPDIKIRNELERLLLKGPKANGYKNELWTLKRISEVLCQITGVKLSIARTWTLIREMGWSCQRPARRARQRKEEQVQEFITKTWENVKKKQNQKKCISHSKMKVASVSDPP